MTKGLFSFVFSCTQAIGTILIANSILYWHKFTPLKEGLLLLIGVVCCLISVFIWYRYRDKVDYGLNPNMTNTRLRSLYAKYPLLLRFIAMAIAVTVGMSVFIFLEKY